MLDYKEIKIIEKELEKLYKYDYRAGARPYLYKELQSYCRKQNDCSKCVFYKKSLSCDLDWLIHTLPNIKIEVNNEKINVN